jgi:hypothetical protein
MLRSATVAPLATPAAGGTGSGTLAWLRGELDRAWANGDAPKARLVARLIDDVRRCREEGRPAAARNRPPEAPTTQAPPPRG